MFNLAACNTSSIKEENIETSNSANIDYFEIQKQADTAYLNDDLVESEKGYQILVKEKPAIAQNWFRLANIFVRTNRPSAAITLYREAVIRNPKYTKAWYNLSIVQLKQTAYSLNEMIQYADIDDPLYDKAKDLLEGIKTIIEQK